MLRDGMAAAAVALGSVCLAGCGGSGDAADSVPSTVEDYVPPAGITVEEWRTQMTGLCEALASQADPFAGRPAPDDPAEALALIGEVFALVDEQMLIVANVPPPAGRLRDLEQLQADLAEMRGTTGRGKAATDAGDVAGAYAALREASRQSAVLNARLRDLGVPACTE